VCESIEVEASYGRWCFGKTPMQPFLDALRMTKEKMTAARQRQAPKPDRTTRQVFRATCKEVDGREERAFTPVFDGLCAAMTFKSSLI